MKINFPARCFNLKNYRITGEISFKEFLFQFAGKEMLKPQMYWLKDFNGNIPMDFIGRFENLREDMHQILERLDIKDNSLPHILKGSSEDYRKHFDIETNSLIMDIYQEEINVFGYTFD